MYYVRCPRTVLSARLYTYQYHQSPPNVENEVPFLVVIPASFQVYDSYGQKCNYRFLLNYGFSVEKNVDFGGFCPNEVLAGSSFL